MASYDSEITYLRSLELCFILAGIFIGVMLLTPPKKNGKVQTTTQDTAQVVGYDPNAPMNSDEFCLSLIDKNGKLMELRGIDMENSVMFERGDTVVIKKSPWDTKIVKNLSQQRLIERKLRAQR